jgi:hypothetical protein
VGNRYFIFLATRFEFPDPSPRFQPKINASLTTFERLTQPPKTYWALARDGVYFVDAANTVSPAKIINIGMLQRAPFYGLALSPDGQSLIYSQSDRDENQILVMKDFR